MARVKPAPLAGRQDFARGHKVGEVSVRGRYQRGGPAHDVVSGETDVAPSKADVIAEMQQQLANEMLMTGDSLLADIEAITGLKGEIVTRGCKEANYLEFDNSVDEHDASYCISLGTIGPSQGLNTGATVTLDNSGLLLVTGFPNIENQLSLFDVEGQRIEVTRNSPGIYQANKAMMPGVYVARISGHVFRLMVMDK